MINNDIEIIIIKFLNRSLNAEELDILNDWILNPKNELFFENYVKTHYEITVRMNEPDLESIKKEKTFIYKLKFNPVYKLAAAAVIAILVSLPFALKNTDVNNTPMVVEQSIILGTDKATLTLKDGSTVTF